MIQHDFIIEIFIYILKIIVALIFGRILFAIVYFLCDDLLEFLRNRKDKVTGINTPKINIKKQ